MKFTHHTTPSVLHTLSEGRALLELGLTGLTLPMLMRGPRGDKHKVLVLPGFLASDVSTRPLRAYLRLKGYRPHGWKLGRNLGQDIVSGKHLVSDRLLNRVLDLYAEDGEKISLIGWSLGGMMAREVARLMPGQIRSVITLGSPFSGPHSSSPMAKTLFKMLNGPQKMQIHDPHHRLPQPVPVASTTIFSRTDGITFWRACMEHLHHQVPNSENVEVRGSHLGLGHNPAVLWVIANRLAQPEGQWRPFEKIKSPGWIFPDPHRA